MIEFADSHVDLMGNITFTPEQLMKRWNRELLRKYSKIVQDNLRDLKQIIDGIPEDTGVNTLENRTLLAEFETDKLATYMRRLEDEAKNALLIGAIAYENAVRDKARLELAITGQDYIAPTEEVVDPETLEVITPYSPGQREIAPMVQTVTVINDEGAEEEAQSPIYTQALADIAAADEIISGAVGEVLALVETRTNTQ